MTDRLAYLGICSDMQVLDPVTTPLLRMLNMLDMVYTSLASRLQVYLSTYLFPDSISKKKKKK